MKNKIFLVTGQVLDASLSNDDYFKLREMYVKRMCGTGADIIFASNPHNDLTKFAYDYLVIDIREIAAILSSSLQGED